MRLDRTDRALLAELQRDGRLTNRDLADRVHLSESACLRRVRALEEAGVIDRYAAVVSQNKVGLPGNVFVSITLNRQDQTDLSAFEEAVKRVPEVMECYLMTGPQDYLLRVVVSDPSDFERVHSQHLTRLPGVARVQSSFALRTVRKSDELPVRE
jgi:DNA-binding Lrp family transcriptional regulator